MSWIALVPLKLGPDRKSRLAPRLGAFERAALSDFMACHVLACLEAAPSVSEIVTLSLRAVGQARWVADKGRGLNTELLEARATIGTAPLLVIHADLPLLAVEDVEALVAAAGGGVALAPDRHGEGTNALAVGVDPGFEFRFGPGSLAAHRAARPAAKEVARRGLSHDIDTPDDLDAAVAVGFRSPFR